MQIDEYEAAKRRWIDDQIESFVIPHCVNHISAKKALNFFDTSNFSEHRLRYLLTLDLIERNIDLSGKILAETGHLSGLSQWLVHNGLQIDPLEGDFRKSIDGEDQNYDVVFSFEVIEHIKDENSDNFSDIVLFNYSGVNNYIKEMHRIIKPGGLLVLTTPNPTSLFCIKQAIDRSPPWVFVDHVREYSPNEIRKMFQKIGFMEEYFATSYSSFYLNVPERTRLLDEIFGSNSDAKSHRGDDSFFIFRRL